MPAALISPLAGPKGRAGVAVARSIAETDLPHERDQVIHEVLLDDLTSSHLAMVKKSTSNDLPVGGISFPSGPCIGPVIVPVNRKPSMSNHPKRRRSCRVDSRLGCPGTSHNAIASAR